MAMWLNELVATAACPTCPTSENQSRTAESGASSRISDLSDLSDLKMVKGKSETGAASPLCRELPFVPDVNASGLPCCLLHKDDLQGMGVPAGALPPCLKGFSLNGWSLGFDAGGGVVMEPGPRARWEQGCRAYLALNREKVARDLKLWGQYVKEWGLYD